MIRNYLKIAFRNLLKNKVYSFINIGGLAVGMAVAILICLWIYDELSYNKFHKNYDRIAQVMQHQTFNGNKGTEQSLPIIMGDELRKTYGSDFKYVVMSTWSQEHILSYGDKKISKPGQSMEPDAARLLSLNMISGDYNGLQEPNSILISKSTATAIFGNKQAYGQIIKIDNKQNLKVTGVYEDLPYKTELKYLTYILTWKYYLNNQKWAKEAYDTKQWGNNSWQCYAQIADNAIMDKVSEKIKWSKFKQVSKEDQQFKAEIFLNPMADWHLRSNWENGVKTGGYIGYVYMFGIIGLFVLLLACINFMNLSTARSEKRAREVGVRKAIGSFRSQLINQFLSESYLVVIIAFIFCSFFVILSLPFFNEITDKRIVFPWTEPTFWIMSIVFIFITGLLAGSYPALYLSSFQPVKVLKGTFKVGRFASMPRKVLVVTQFSVSIILIIGTMVVNQQVQHTKNRPLGYDSKGVLMIPMKSPDFYVFGKYDMLRNELKGNNTIVEMSESSSPMTGNWSNNGGFNWQGKDPSLQTDFAFVWATHEYGKVANWKLKEGRDFSRDFATDSSAFIINEAAVKFMGVKNPLGMTVRWGDDKDGKDFKIIGIVKDILVESPYEPVKQTIYAINGENVNWMNIKLNPQKPVKESLATIEATFKKQIPSAPFDYKFADAEFGNKFQSEERVGKLSRIFAVLAIFISCLGLFGLASFVAEQRTKEIGIRKVLGATVANLWQLLSKDFVILVIISCLIATPIAFYFMHNWLQKYTYRTEISWWIFVAAGFGALLITLFTVSYQAIKAALMNPVNSLKTE
ncbi:MAG: ABC transporter permease [Bacteroidota bacterium]